ncbi:DUF4294 domain-containing protein [Paraflavitalea speifideaquila]|uniref:DUF4294 domain-containing protein n=1 Tax=Paraflavitalea speifideaquila TaxID=3076558 RepID=UPI0028E7E671|nr:DUF4294 domain-containing protein [Paraflavitalea speifideiaquila]
MCEYHASPSHYIQLFDPANCLPVCYRPGSGTGEKDTIPLPPGVEHPVLGPNDTIPVPAIITGNQLIPSGNMEWLWVTAPYPKHLLKKRQEWTRLRNAIYVTYPYARKAGTIINEINNRLSGVTDKEERKKYLKTREKELKKEFSDPLSNLSVYQGKVLMKLINRQTGNNCYEIIKEYKGGFTARVYKPWPSSSTATSNSLMMPRATKRKWRSLYRKLSGCTGCNVRISDC